MRQCCMSDRMSKVGINISKGVAALLTLSATARTFRVYVFLHLM